MREFGSFGAFAEFLVTRVAATAAALDASLEAAARMVEKRAKEKFGEYQDEATPFVAWAPLAPSTVAEKERLGYAPPDNPLLRTGEARDSIEHRIEGLEAEVGSNDEVMVYLELGTARMPPRSTLGAAAVEKEAEIVERVGEGIMLALTGEHVVAGRLPIRE